MFGCQKSGAAATPRHLQDTLDWASQNYCSIYHTHSLDDVDAVLCQLLSRQLMSTLSSSHRPRPISVFAPEQSFPPLASLSITNRYLKKNGDISLRSESDYDTLGDKWRRVVRTSCPCESRVLLAIEKHYTSCNTTTDAIRTQQAAPAQYTVGCTDIAKCSFFIALKY